MRKPKPVIKEAAILITDKTSTLRYFLVCKKKKHTHISLENLCDQKIIDFPFHHRLPKHQIPLVIIGLRICLTK